MPIDFDDLPRVRSTSTGTLLEIHEGGGANQASPTQLAIRKGCLVRLTNLQAAAKGGLRTQLVAFVDGEKIILTRPYMPPCLSIMREHLR